MKSALILLLLIVGAFLVTRLIRLGARRRARAFSSLKDFDEAVSDAIREAGSHDHPHASGHNAFRLRDLWFVRLNTWWLLSVASELLESLSDIDDKNKRIRVEDLYCGLQNVSCSLTYKLLLSIPEIIRGRFRADTQYFYTQEVAHCYCVGVDTVETMASLANKPAATRLRRHLA